MSVSKIDPGSDPDLLADGHDGDEHAAEIRAALARALDRDLTPEHRVALDRLRDRQAGR